MSPAPADLLIRGGAVIDGTGKAPLSADVAIKDGRIACVEPRWPGTADRVLEAAGLWVAPGFIDIHSHSDFTLLADPRAMSSIAQGVTLEVVGNCGHGCAPLVDPTTAWMNVYGYAADYPIDWRSVGQYLERLQERRPAVNVLTLVPNGRLRLAVAGLVDRPSTPDELRRMKELLQASLEEGTFGFSTGLEYGPERACSEEEIAELCGVVAECGGLYATHTRNQAGEDQETIAEAIRTAQTAGVALQISHISVVARLAADGVRAVDGALEQVDRARRAGLDVDFDMHTRLFGTTNLSAALPPEVLEGGQAAVAARLRDPEVRRRVGTYRSIVAGLAQGDWQRILLSQYGPRPELAGQSLADIGRDMGLEPVDLICELLLAAQDRVHEPMILAFCYREDEVRRVFAHPRCMVGSDATALCPDGPLQGAVFHGAYTWAGWFFRHFVRDTGLLSPEAAVHRLTGLPAGRLGLEGPGDDPPGRLGRPGGVRRPDLPRTGHGRRAQSHCPGHGPRAGQRRAHTRRRGVDRGAGRAGAAPGRVRGVGTCAFNDRTAKMQPHPIFLCDPHLTESPYREVNHQSACGIPLSCVFFTSRSISIGTRRNSIRRLLFSHAITPYSAHGGYSLSCRSLNGR